MAAITRQPFAPLDGARLQTLTSLKNRQNAISSNAPVKRKAADVLDTDDFENVDPSSLFSKRSKGGADGGFFCSPTKGKSTSTPDFFKPSSILTDVDSAAAPAQQQDSSATTPPSLSPLKALSRPPRHVLNPKSPAAKLNTIMARSPMSAPAGRSPTRGSKRVGIMGNRRRTGSGFTRVDPPSFALPGALSSSSASSSGRLSAAPFSLDAALRGTIPSYAARSSSSSVTPASAVASLNDDDLKSSWFFDIHEDTPEQEMTNLLQHGTCVLDISSDEESELRASREQAEGRDKENIPPADDVSQTSSSSARGRGRAAAVTCGDDAMMMIMSDEKAPAARDPLAEMNAADFYAEGCDLSSVVFIPADEETEEEVANAEESCRFDLASQLEKSQDRHSTEEQTIDELLSAPAPAPALAPAATTTAMTEVDPAPAPAVAVLEPMEGTTDSFDLWESGSAREDGEGGVDSPVPASPAPSNAETEILGEEF